MCGHHVIDSVRSAMLSRRNLILGGAAASAAAATQSLVPPRAAASTGGGTISDLTHTLSEDFPTFSGPPGFSKSAIARFDENGFNMFEVSYNEHTGTHLDAPLHFSSDRQSVDEVPVGNLMAPLAIVDIREKADGNPDAQVTPDDLKAWIAQHGAFPSRAAIAMNAGWDRHADSRMFRNADDDGVLHFPGFHHEATQMLLEETDAVGMVVDTLSLDYGPSADFATHYAWLPTNRWGLECVAGLSDLPPRGATLIVGAPKNRGGTGGPTRVFALH